MLAKVLLRQIPKHGDLSAGFRSRHVRKLIKRQPHKADACPTFSGPSEHFYLGPLLLAERTKGVRDTRWTTARAVRLPRNFRSKGGRDRKLPCAVDEFWSVNDRRLDRLWRHVRPADDDIRIAAQQNESDCYTETADALHGSGP